MRSSTGDPPAAIARSVPPFPRRSSPAEPTSSLLGSPCRLIHTPAGPCHTAAHAPVRRPPLRLAAPTGLRRSPRRYLILTYCAEFDRVHYPLPLMVDESPTSDAMKQTIKRLRCAQERCRGIAPSPCTCALS